MKKRLLAFMAVGVMTVSGCGNSNDSKSEDDFSEIQWPTSEVAKTIPMPESNIGHIEWDKSDSFCVLISDTPMEAYEAYVDKCMEAGFDIDYSKFDDWYSGENENGYDVMVSYEDGDIMRICIDAPKEESAPEEPSESEEPTSESTEGINPDFKAALDSYEAFFDEYISFMKKYNESSDTSSMLTEYTNYMTQYVDTMSKLEDLNTDDLTEEEAAYYAEVSARILKKTAEILG